MYVSAWPQRKNHHQQVHFRTTKQNPKYADLEFTLKQKQVNLKTQPIIKNYLSDKDKRIKPIKFMSKTSNKQKIETLKIWLDGVKKKTPKPKQPKWIKDLEYED